MISDPALDLYMQDAAPETMPEAFRRAYDALVVGIKHAKDSVNDIYSIPADADGYRTLPNGRRVRVGDENCLVPADWTAELTA